MTTNITNNLLQERVLASKEFENFARMTSSQFEILLKMVAPLIKKKDTNMRNAIPVQERLLVTLRYLGTGESQNSLRFSFKISQSSINSIISETVEGIIASLFKKFVKFPCSVQEWCKISKGFEQKWGFPHVLGCVDGKIKI